MIGSTLLASRDGFATHSPVDDYWYEPRPSTNPAANVTEELAMRYATVYACVNKLSKTIATLPIHVYKTLPGDKKESVPGHPVRQLFAQRANEEALAVPTRWAMMANLLLWGNAYFEIAWSRSGTPAGINLLYSRFMKLMRDRQTERLVYEYKEPGQPKVELAPANVLHIAGLSYNGLCGMSVIELVSQTVGLGLSMAQYRSAFLENGAAPGVVIERPLDAPQLSDVAGERLLQSFDERHQGSGRAFRTALLREGMTLKTIGMPMKDSQFLELSRFTREDVCGIFDVPPSKIHDDTRSTYSNVEQKNTDWKVDSLVPLCILVESAVDATFFTDSPFYLKHNLDGLVRGDIQARHEAYRTGREIGMYSTNDVRRKEDLDPIDGGDDDFLRPRNMWTEEEREEDTRRAENASRDLVATRENSEATQRNTADALVTMQQVDAKADSVLAQVEAMSVQVVANGAKHQQTLDTTHEAVVSIGTASAELRGEVTAIDDTLGQVQGQQQDVASEIRDLSNIASEQHIATTAALQSISAAIQSKQHAELVGLLLDPAQRLVAKETKAITSAWKRYEKAENRDAFLGWLDKFYTDYQVDAYDFFRHVAGYVAGQLSVSGPEAHASLREYFATVAERSVSAVLAIADDQWGEVPNQLAACKDTRPITIARGVMAKLQKHQPIEGHEPIEEGPEE